MKTPKTIAQFQTYNRNDVTSTGYDISIRENNSIRIESHSNWQNSKTGIVFIANAPTSVLNAIFNPSEEEPDLETALLEWIDESSENDFSNWKKIRSGYIVR
jgi:hypothetical protein